jgi:hypothetical protein
LPPTCPTVMTISTNPGTASSHCAHMRMGIAPRPGFFTGLTG